MNILVSSKYFYPPFGGGEISLYNLLKEISDRHKIHILYADSLGKDGPEDFSFSIKPTKIKNPLIRGYTIRMYFENLLWAKNVLKELRENEYDLLITQLEFSAPSIIAACKVGIPSLLFVRSFEYFCIYGDSTCQSKKCFRCLKKWKDKIEYPFAILLRNMMHTAFNTATIVVANSQFTAKKCMEYYHRRIDNVIYSTGYNKIVFKGQERDPEFIILITPTKLKGVHIFLEIAKKMPYNKFLTVGRIDGGTKEKIKQLPNVTHIEWTDDKEKYLKKAAIMLVPSLCEDTFPRVCLEALTNEIPCIASNKGGIPEAIGKSGILINDPYDIESWVNSINHVLSDKEFRRSLIIEGHRHIQRFTTAESSAKINKLIDKLARS